MLQAALLLHGCALCRYLWGIDVTIASLATGVTSFGVLFYFSIVVAGAASKSCPYQTPGVHALRSAASAASAFGHAVRHSETVLMFQAEARLSKGNVTAFLRRVPCRLPGTLGGDILRLGRATADLSVASTRRVCTRLVYVLSTPRLGSSQPTTFLDIRCVSWMLKTSLDKGVHLSTLEFLATTAPLVDFHPTLVMDCLNIFTGCVEVIGSTVAVTQGSGRLATASAMCLLRTVSHLSVTDPGSSVLRGVRQRYGEVFLRDTGFKNFPFYHTLGAIHSVFYPDYKHPWFDWGDYKPSGHEHSIFALALAKLAQSEYRRRDNHTKKVPGWILRFALHSMSSDPLPSTSVVADCLSIVAIDLGCNISSAITTTSDERYVHTRHALTSLTRN